MKIINEKAIVIGLEKVDLKDFPDLKVLGVNCTGLDHLDWDTIKERNIKVISLKDYPVFMSGITSTAEHTIGLIIALMRNYRTALNPPYKERDFYKGHTLSGKTLGIIGYGRVGKQVERIAEGFGMKVLYFDLIRELGATMSNAKGKFLESLENLLEMSDIISLHIPLEGNIGFFTKEMFRKRKPTAYFVNTSRLGVVEEGALLFALENNIIAGAAVDFIENFELLEYSKTHDNLILTNHQGGNTVEDLLRTENFIINLTNNYLHEIGLKKDNK